MANKTVVTAEPGKQELFIIREFDAPRDLVIKAHTDPALYVQWVGPRDLTMADRDGMIRSGMERGVNDGYEKLDGILTRMQEPNTAAA